MGKYLDILLLSNGVFCVAPPWTVNEGDLVGLTDLSIGADKVFEVLSTVTDEVDGDFVKMIKRYVGFELPKVTKRYRANDLIWEAENDVHE